MDLPPPGSFDLTGENYRPTVEICVPETLEIDRAAGPLVNRQEMNLWCAKLEMSRVYALAYTRVTCRPDSTDFGACLELRQSLLQDALRSVREADQVLDDAIARRNRMAPWQDLLPFGLLGAVFLLVLAL